MPTASGTLTLIKTMNSFAGRLGYHTPLDKLFGDSSDDSQELLEAFTAEVQALLATSSFDNTVKNTTGQLDAARIFLTQTYANQVTATPPVLPDERFNNLNPWVQGTGGPLTAATTLLAWMNGSPEPAKNSKPPAVSIYLGLYAILCKLFQEQVAAAAAAAAPGAALSNPGKSSVAWQGDEAAARLSVRSTARTALDNMASLVMTMITDRIIDVIYWEDAQARHIPATRKSLYWVAAHLYDRWLDGLGTAELIASEEYSPGDSGSPDRDYVTAMKRVWDAYPKVLWDGNSAACDELKSALGSDKFDKRGFMDSDLRGDFLAASYDMVCSFGQWASQARALLLKIDLIASGLPGTQEDSWVLCQQCGVLYHGLGGGPCPAGGQHQSFFSPNFVVHRLPTTPLPSVAGAPAAGAPNTMTGFVRCSTCHILQRPDAYGQCSRGTQHTSETGVLRTDDAGHQYTDTGNSFVCTGVAPSGDAAPPGISTVVGGWHFCRVCGGIYLTSATIGNVTYTPPSVCAGGGPHITIDEIPPIWLTFLGSWWDLFIWVRKHPVP